MRALVTGASGLLGGNLAAELLAQGHSVLALRRANSRVGHLSHLALSWVEQGLDQVDGLVAAFEGADLVFHCAGLVSVLDQADAALTEVNVHCTRRVLLAAARAGVARVVHCSSVVTVGASTDGQPIDEDAVWNLDRYGLANGYTDTKRQAEALVIQAVDQGQDVVIVNPGYVFGPLDARPSTGSMILDVVNRRLPGSTAGAFNFVHARDVARGMLLAWRRGQAGRRYILGGENLSYPQLFTLIGERAGCRVRTWPVPLLLGRVAGRLGSLQQAISGREPRLTRGSVRWAYADNLLYSSARACAELGYEPGPVHLALDDALAWFRQEGML